MRKGLERMDWSEWETYSRWHRRDKLESICGLISTGRMPRLYSSMRPDARLGETEKEEVWSRVKGKTLKEKDAWRKIAAGLQWRESGLAPSHPVTACEEVGSIPATSSIRRSTAEKSFSSLFPVNSSEFT